MSISDQTYQPRSPYLASSPLFRKAADPNLVAGYATGSVQTSRLPLCARSGRSISAPHFNISIIGAFLRSQLGNLSKLVSIGRVRMRLAVAAKIAFVTAGATTAVGASPKPPGASELLTRCVSTIGASSIRNGR
jgi:hypothetical protein